MYFLFSLCIIAPARILSIFGVLPLSHFQVLAAIQAISSSLYRFLASIVPVHHSNQDCSPIFLNWFLTDFLHFVFFSSRSGRIHHSYSYAVPVFLDKRQSVVNVIHTYVYWLNIRSFAAFLFFILNSIISSSQVYFTIMSKIPKPMKANFCFSLCNIHNLTCAYHIIQFAFRVI